MNESLREAAKALYDVGNSLSCKVCVKCKEKKVNENLSCVDCIEDGLKNLIDRATPMKPYNFKKLSEWYCPCCHQYVEIDALNNPAEYRAKFCKNCGQAILWEDEE